VVQQPFVKKIFFKLKNQKMHPNFDRAWRKSPEGREASRQRFLNLRARDEQRRQQLSDEEKKSYFPEDAEQVFNNWMDRYGEDIVHGLELGIAQRELPALPWQPEGEHGLNAEQAYALVTANMTAHRQRLDNALQMARQNNIPAARRLAHDIEHNMPPQEQFLDVMNQRIINRRLRRARIRHQQQPRVQYEEEERQQEPNPQPRRPVVQHVSI
jgi:hypothetical protein